MGRPRKRWLDKIEEDIEKMGNIDWEKCIRDRQFLVVICTTAKALEEVSIWRRNRGNSETILRYMVFTTYKLRANITYLFLILF